MKKELFLNSSVGLPLFHQAIAKHKQIPLNKALSDADAQVSIMEHIQKLFPNAFLMTPYEVHYSKKEILT